jgi:hypothetical protein
MRHFIIAVLLCGCASTADDRPRSVFEADGFSVATPTGWTSSRELGTVVFRRTDGARGSLAVRSAPLDGEWVEARTLENVIPATQRALEALPEAKVKATGEVEFAGMRGASFDVSFRPARGKGIVDRRHIVLVGSTHVFHVFASAQRGDLKDLEPVLQGIVSSIREEG